MILNIRVNNYLAYSHNTDLSLVADMRIKKFSFNVKEIAGFNVLKSACIYGANNVGKSCLMRAVNSIKNVLLGYVAEVPTNIFNNDNRCSLGVTFDYDGKIYSYDFTYDLTFVSPQVKRGFIYERFAELSMDVHGNIAEREIFVRDMDNNLYKFDGNGELAILLGAVSANNILIYTINNEKYSEVEKCRSILRGFADSIDIINMYNIPIIKTLQVLKDHSDLMKKTVDLIKLADLDIDDYKYIKNVASSEIYATWPDATIRANVLAIMSFTMNRVYTEWYRNKGYNFTITSSTAYDQKWSYGRNIFSNISLIVDEMFQNYLSRPNVSQPILTQYCDGQRVSCPNWMT